MDKEEEKPSLTVGEFVKRATPLVAEKYGITLEQARELVVRCLKDEYAQQKLN